MNDLLPCPFCGNELYRSSRLHNPKAYCVTEECYGKRMSVVNLDDPVCVAMWNARAPAQCVLDHDKIALLAQRDALWMALEAIAMRDQEFGFDAGKVAREALNSVVETPGSGS